MVGCTAIGKVMMVICSNMRISARLLKKLGDRIVKRFQRAPAAVQERSVPWAVIVTATIARRACAILLLPRTHHPQVQHSALLSCPQLLQLLPPATTTLKTAWRQTLTVEVLIVLAVVLAAFVLWAVTATATIASQGCVILLHLHMHHHFRPQKHQQILQHRRQRHILAATTWTTG